MQTILTRVLQGAHVSPADRKTGEQGVTDRRADAYVGVQAEWGGGDLYVSVLTNVT